MQEVTSVKEKDKIKPYRKIQLSILFLLCTLIFFAYLMITTHKELSKTLVQSDNLFDQLKEKQDKNEFLHAMHSRLQVNYESIYQLDTRYTSDIIHSPSDFFQILDWAGELENTKSSFYLCYKATIDGDTAEQFHSKCEGSSPLLFLIETVDGYRFGAYITEALMRRGNNVYDMNAFLFSFDTMRKYDVTIPELAYKDMEKGFPMFGKNDIYVIEGFLNHAKSVSSFPQAYEKDEEFLGDYPLTGGLKSFRIKEMEVMVVFSNYIDDNEM